MANGLLALVAAWPLLGPAAGTPAGTPALTPLSLPAPQGHEYALPASFTNRRTLSHFFSNAGRNVTGMWSRDNSGPLFVGLVATGVATFGDSRAQHYFQSNPMPGLTNAGAKSGGMLVVAGSSLALLGLSQTVGGDRFRAAAYDTTQAVLVNTLYTFALKSTTHRTRPDGTDRLSFPSGHTSNAFAIATVWSKQYGTRAAIPGYFLASLVGVSRMSGQKHHLSDVVAGATLGYLVGSTVVKNDGGRVGGGERRRLSFGLDGGPAGDGVGVALRLDLKKR
jgi:membrane-associated phospholipid phosphatase